VSAVPDWKPSNVRDDGGPVPYTAPCMPGQTKRCCGDGVCDGPEMTINCPVDCAGATPATLPSNGATSGGAAPAEPILAPPRLPGPPSSGSGPDGGDPGGGQRCAADGDIIETVFDIHSHFTSKSLTIRSRVESLPSCVKSHCWLDPPDVLGSLSQLYTGVFNFNLNATDCDGLPITRSNPVINLVFYGRKFPMQRAALLSGTNIFVGTIPQELRAVPGTHIVAIELMDGWEEYTSRTRTCIPSTCQLTVVVRDASIESCVAGTQYDEIARTCVGCAPGFYKNKDSVGPCQGCQAGFYSPRSQSLKCSVCDDFMDGNAYQNATASTACQLCPTGTQRRPGTKGESAQDCV
jgi:hypothetical protein